MYRSVLGERGFKYVSLFINLYREAFWLRFDWSSLTNFEKQVFRALVVLLDNEPSNAQRVFMRVNIAILSDELAKSISEELKKVTSENAKEKFPEITENHDLPATPSYTRVQRCLTQFAKNGWLNKRRFSARKASSFLFWATPEVIAVMKKELPESFEPRKLHFPG